MPAIALLLVIQPLVLSLQFVKMLSQMYIIQEQHSYLAALDARFARLAEVRRPRWLGSEAIMYSASYWTNPTLILYCLNAQSCANHR